MYSSKNDLHESIRREIVDLLQKYLSDGIDLVLQTKQAHWNVKGPHFTALHELFDKVHEDIEANVDLVAERIVQLGGIADGTHQAVVKYSSLPEYPLNASKDYEHIEALCNSIFIFDRVIRQGIRRAHHWKDAVTADILTEMARGLDKNLWLVESHLSKKSPEIKSVRGVA